MKCLTCGKETEKKFCPKCTQKAIQKHKQSEQRMKRWEMMGKYDCVPSDYNLSESDMWE